MFTLERKVTEVGEYLSKIEEDFPLKVSNGKHFFVEVKSIIDDEGKNSNQKSVLLAEMIYKLSDYLEQNWEDFPEEVYEFFEEIISKINELESESEPGSITETDTDSEATEPILMLSRSLERLKGVLQDIVEFVKISKFVRDKRSRNSSPEIKEEAKEIIKKAKTSEKDPQILKKLLSTYLKKGDLSQEKNLS